VAVLVAVAVVLVVLDLVAAFGFDRGEQGAIVGLLTPLAVALAGAGAILNLRAAQDQSRRTFRITEEQLELQRGVQLADRFTRAIDQLGRTEPEDRSVRIGGIYALEQIARESPELHWPVIEVLTAFIRDHRSDDVSTEVQAALTVVGRRRTGLDQAPLDLRSVLLPSVDLRDAHLERARLDGAHLEGANLRDARLERASLGEAHLEGAQLEGAHLEGADLRYAHLEPRVPQHVERSVPLDDQLKPTNLRGAHLQEANLEGARLEGAWLDDAHLERADLRYAQLRRANLAGAHLDGANLVGAYLEGANLVGAQLKGANLRNAQLQRAVLEGAYLEDAKLAGADVEGALLSPAYLERANADADWSQLAADERPALTEGSAESPAEPGR
jgi:uncharacterized protein YjbI with pentapeptide repeats